MPLKASGTKPSVVPLEEIPEETPEAEAVEAAEVEAEQAARQTNK